MRFKPAMLLKDSEGRFWGLHRDVWVHRAYECKGTSFNKGAETHSYVNMNEEAQGQANKKTYFTCNEMWTHVEKCLFIVGQETYNTFSDTTGYQRSISVQNIAQMIYKHKHMLTQGQKMRLCGVATVSGARRESTALI